MLPHATAAAATCTGTFGYGTFSYIDAVYGPSNMDSNYLCNGLAHGGTWLWSVVCPPSYVPFKYHPTPVYDYIGFSPGTSYAFWFMVYNYNTMFANGLRAGTNRSACK
jgi:hypothetical protein